MKKIPMFVLITIVLLQACVSVPDLKPYEKREVSNVLENRYCKKLYEKYSGKILVKNIGGFFEINNCDKIILLDSKCENYLCLFTSGLINREILGFTSTKTDTLKIHEVIECKEFNKGDSIKFFKLNASSSTYVLNPIFYLIELTNEKGKRMTSLRRFIKESRLTFVANWIWI